MVRYLSSAFIVALCAFVILPGCNNGKSAKNDADKNAGNKEHDHGEFGPHGGPLAEWEDKYHAEFTVDFINKKAVVYLLDDKVKSAPKIDAAKITKMKLTLLDARPPLQMDLTLDNDLSGEKGFAFVATNDAFAKPRDIKGNISGVVNVDKPVPYTGDFSYKLPAKAELFLMPGGAYTPADVAANGNTTAAIKFKDVTMAHDDALKSGDKICPISKKKAQAECYWIVKGQRYEFCCPPCVASFLKLAHNEPSKIKDAKEYVAK